MTNILELFKSNERRCLLNKYFFSCTKILLLHLTHTFEHNAVDKTED